MAEDSVLLNISDMIDLAIGTPEVGVVDFNMLQTILHCLAQQMRVLGKNVELRGSVAALPVGRENVQTISINEYVIDTDKKAPPVKKPEPSPPPSEETILVVERVKKAESFPRIPAKPQSQGPSPAPDRPPAPPSAAAPKAAKSGIVPPAAVSSTERLSLVTLSKFNVLENMVEDLKNRVYGSMPKNEEILEEVRSQTNIKAITDMWTSLNVSSRLEAAEAGVSKLSSLVQDLITETTELQDALKRRGSKTQVGGGGAPGQPAGGPPAAGPPAAGGPAAGPPAAGAPAAGPPAPGQPAAGPPAAGGPAAAAPGGYAPAAPAPVALPNIVISADVSPAQAEAINNLKNELEILYGHVDGVKADLDQLTNSFYAMLSEAQSKAKDAAGAPAGTPAAAPAAPAAAAPAAAAAAAPASGGPAAGAPAARPGPQPLRGGVPAGLADKVSALEKQLKVCCEQITKNNGLVQDQINSFQDQLEYLSKQVSGLAMTGGGGGLSPDLIKDLQGLMQLFQTVQEMQDQLKKVHDTALQLAAEKEDRQHHINALLEQIELLKTIKLDREDMVEAMADKADLRMLARKVSHDQFEMACDDLSRGLEHAIGKLNMQEALWQQALDDIQREIETKLDKMELSPVKEFFNGKLKQLQENLKQMASLRREAEAAGTKRKLLRDVNCISCDANAMMAMEAPSSLPVLKPLPANLSMKPYLSYELDAIRKSQASNLPQRNMHDWENIDKQMTQPKQMPKVRSEANKHICNRYCGGSHTVTTPAQRVARLGHFIKQWGPDVLPLSSTLAAGDDGKMYRVSPTEGAKVGPGGAVETCTPKVQKKPELPKPTGKSLVISAECRCLEGDAAK